MVIRCCFIYDVIWNTTI